MEILQSVWSRAGLATSFLLALATAVAVPALAQSMSPQQDVALQQTDEEIYLQRYRQLQSSILTGLEQYEPLEAVRGAAHPRPLPARAAAKRTISDEALAAARRYAEANRSDALLVWRDGALEDASYFGGADAGSSFPSRSLAKPVTAIAVGRAMALGHIRSLDQPVADFIAEWRNDPRKSRVLVRHLLDMRSGLLPQSSDTSPANILIRAYLHPRHEQILVKDYPLVDEPGSRYEYSNAASELVALLIERASGMRYADFLSREILQPLGAAGGHLWINRPQGLAHSGCCLMLPRETWIRLGVLLMQDGVWEGLRLLPPGFVAQMTTGTPQNPYYGLGVYVAGPYLKRRGFLNPEREPESRRVLHGEPYLAGDLFMFDGNSNQVLYIVPSERLVVLRTGATPPRDAQREWDNSVLPNTLIRGIRRTRSEQAPQPRAVNAP